MKEFEELTVVDNGYFFDIKADRMTIADTCAASSAFDDGKHIQSGMAHKYALLFAASPDLLEALTLTMDDIGHWLSTQKPELKEKIELAIKKALGE